MDDRIKWLTHYPYNEESKDRFYYKTIHVENGYMITTDGRWMRICPSDIDEEEGDFYITLKGMKRKQSDRFWYFTPSWKTILEYTKLQPEKEAKDVQDLASYIYKEGLNVNIHDLAHLEEAPYSLIRVKSICIFSFGGRFTII